MSREDNAISSPSPNEEFGDSVRTVFRRRVLQGGLGVATLALLGNPREVLAQSFNQFFAIITNFGTAPRVSAHMDVSMDTRAAPTGTDVLFNVFEPEGSQLAEFAVQTNTNGFVSSAWAPPPNRNLFRVSNDGPALIRARTPLGASKTTASLHQRGQGNRLVIGVPPARKVDGSRLALGTLFPVALGDIAAASLLVANVSGSDVTVDVFIGTKGADGTGKHSIPRLKNNALGRIDLAQDDDNAHLVVSATGDIIVQLMIDDGRVNGVTCIPI